MNRQALLISLALAFPCSALADSEIYGVAHVSLDFVDDGADSAHQLSSNASRLGLRGYEDLGFGLMAIWQIESDVNLTGGGGDWATRNSYVGLSGDWGKALFGRHDTPYKLSTGRLDVFADTLADYNALMGNLFGTPWFDWRSDNTLMYMSPSMGGMSVNLAWSTDVRPGGDRPGYVDQSGRANDNNMLSLSVGYDLGPLYLTAAWERYRNDLYWADTDEAPDSTAAKLGGSYRLGMTTVNLAWERIDVGRTDRSGWYLSGRHDIGNSYLAAAYAQAQRLDGLPDSGASMFALGGGYNFSSRTEIYALYTQTQNDDEADYGLGFGGHGKPVYSLTGEKAHGVSFGVRHRF
ncbi:MAG: porin [Chromatiales bacterium]|jgi:predicted porin|nr:porin [Chromatiales bacterium]MDX9768025.1 porin [Ectothiorhodospiraceae bacterium]